MFFGARLNTNWKARGVRFPLMREKQKFLTFLPIRVFGKDGVRVKELFFDKAVNVKCIECCDLSFDK